MQNVTRTSTATRLAASGALITLIAAPALAQRDWAECFDPKNTTPISLDYALSAVGNQMIIGGVGFSGNVNWGPESPCGVPPGNEAQNVVGYLMLMTGGTGSSFTGADDFAGMSMGAPYAGNNWSFATIRVVDAGGTTSDTKWAENGFSFFLAPTASVRRIRAAAAADGGVSAELELRVIGNAVRYQWTLTNQNEEAVSVGLRHATWLGLINHAEPPLGPPPPFGGLVSGWNRNAYVYLPTGRPLLTEQRFIRATDPLGFPKSVDFHYRQSRTSPALRIGTTFDASHPDQTQADQVDISNFTGGMGGSLWNFGVTPDRGLFQTAVGIFYNPTIIPAGGSRTIVYYLEVPFQANDLAVTTSGGYAAATEAPTMIAWDNGANALSPNPFNIVAWVDNQYAWINLDLTMTDVQLTLTLPNGLTFAPGETAIKSIASLGPNGTTSRQWSVIADGNRPGIYSYSIQISPGPNAQLPFAPKTLSGKLVVAAAPQQNFVTGPNLVTNPWVLANTNMAVATGLSNPGDFIAWNWDVLTQSYVPATAFQRGRGQWLVMNGDFPGNPYIGATSSGQDVPGGFAFTVRRGWNLIGNPYLYPIQLNQLNVVSSFNPNEVLTWIDVTQRGWIRSVIFAYNTALAEYTFSSDSSQLLPAHVGYWIYVNTESTLTVFWPPVFLPGLPGSPRSSNEWAVPTQNKWRVQFALRGEGSSDSAYVGSAPNQAEANTLSAPKPPAAPGAKVRMSIVREPNGEDPINWAQDIREGTNRQTFKMQANVTEPGTYTLSWPNISHMPNNLRARLVDKSNNQARDLRTSSAYVFTANEAGPRQFELVIEPGTASRAVIGNVMVSGSSRDPQAPISIQYSLSAAATVTSRILSVSGTEVFSMSRGRAENAGVNTVIWNKRMTDGTAVAPGNYLVEIIAETADGQRVRVTRPVVVTR